ncbi:hypothetical protein DFQ28_001803 [Apophysomyces sp. BC1034]|nr:hypothetical protein DFQ30_002402 [Apophysomyces sp. BC1015]KAG0180751.1 hypothetical protein DFQ29_010192 [Apophysomyces sp. BC1021]KAG0190596.1 hypothetical protein DFQ28_001803 [Apophysomyces sp. BC1034]
MKASVIIALVALFAATVSGTQTIKNSGNTGSHDGILNDVAAGGVLSGNSKNTKISQTQ